MKEILERVQSDPRYVKNIEYGEPRPGHPEGRIKYHIAELEENLETLVTRGISEEQYWKLKFLIHVHDTFKAEALANVAINNPNSHASLARKFAAEFIDDPDLLHMIQLHDVDYALWQQFRRTGSYSQERLQRLVETIQDWELFLMFLIIDGSTKGKQRAMLNWFFQEAAKYRRTRVDETWFL